MPRTHARHRNEAPAAFRRAEEAPTRAAGGSHRGSHAAPRRRLVHLPKAPVAWAASGLAVTGVVTALALNGGATQADETIPTASSLGDSTDSISRSSERLPLLESGGQVADAGAETSAAEEKKRKDDAKAAEKKRKEAAEQKKIDDAIKDPRGTAESMLADYGWGSDQMSCLDSLWQGESNWDHTATNPSSGAYGIPQSLPATKMATAGSDWKTNPITQIEWGLGYIEDVYGSPCSANSFKSGNNWY